MADKMRLLNLCLKESASTFGWYLSGNYLSCNKGYLSFLLLPTISKEGIDFSLSYRYSAFDRIYHTLTMANIYPGITILESTQPVESWGLMGISLAMRMLTSKADRFASGLAERIINVDDNLDFLRYLQHREIKEGKRPPNISVEMILTHLLTGDDSSALNIASNALLSGDSGSGFYSSVIDYIRRRS